MQQAEIRKLRTQVADLTASQHDTQVDLRTKVGGVVNTEELSTSAWC
jgi:hypothetical protein